jgi:glucose dehydrogenase
VSVIRKHQKSLAVLGLLGAKWVSSLRREVQAAGCKGPSLFLLADFFRYSSHGQRHSDGYKIGSVFQVKKRIRPVEAKSEREKRIGGCFLYRTMVVALLVCVAQGTRTMAQTVTGSPAQQDWPAYGGAPESNHYSKLAQINRSNVKRLEVAWAFDTGEEGGLQSCPLIVGGVLYGISPTQKIFALDASTGKFLWTFNSGIRGTQPNRGLAYRTDGTDKRILAGVMNFLYALDAAAGKPVASFGNQGRIDLRENLGREPASAQSIYLTSPGIIYKDLIIVGGRNSETLPAAPGDIRAFDVRSGKLRWSFHMRD